MTTTRFRLVPEASVAETDGEAVVLHLRTGRFFRVNRSGAPFLAALQRDGGASFAELTASLVATFGIDESRAAGDVLAFIDRLRSAGLVEEFAEASAP